MDNTDEFHDVDCTNCGESTFTDGPVEDDTYCTNCGEILEGN